MRNVNKLIDAVRARPALYDQSLQSPKYLGAKNRSWTEVARAVYGREDKATVNKAKMQWKSLRDAFVKYRRKCRAARTRVRPYLYEDEMRFLLPHILARERAEGAAVAARNFDVKAEEGASASGESHEEPEIQGDAEEREAKSYLWGQNVAERATEAHPVDAFFHGIAQTVKQLKPATVARLKKAVANIVMDAELEEIEGETAKIEPANGF